MGGMGRPHVPHAGAFVSTAAPQYGHGLVGVAILGSPVLSRVNGIPHHAWSQRSPDVLGRAILVYCVCVARRLPGPEGLRGEGFEVRIAEAPVRAYAGESMAAAAFASGARVLSRSLK